MVMYGRFSAFILYFSKASRRCHQLGRRAAASSPTAAHQLPRSPSLILYLARKILLPRRAIIAGLLSTAVIFLLLIPVSSPCRHLFDVVISFIRPLLRISPSGARYCRRLVRAAGLSPTRRHRRACSLSAQSLSSQELCFEHVIAR